ncbi:ribosome-recycling factor, mitochondrial isoform X2 [Anolis carolinensis]|uniref:ribosome-recycling factor, mitochondrial isoform X2 n=1 Tax=Anolis carolinensis TaxID=28377 RepID=UPI002F2B7BB1
MAGSLRCLRRLPLLHRGNTFLGVPLSSLLHGVPKPLAMAGSLRCLRRLPLLLRGNTFLGVPLSSLLHGVPKVLPPPPQARHLATKKAKGKGQARVSINAALVEDILSLEEVGEDMRSVIRALQDDFSKTLNIRTSPGALDHIVVSTKDGKFPLNQLGQVSLQSPQLILVNMSNFPESTAAAQKAIRESGMGLSPQADGPLLRVPLPKVTREHRESLAAVAKQLTNKAKESLRKVRSAAVSRAKKAKGSVSEDTVRLIEKQVQQMTDDAVAEMDKLLAAKTKELLG